MLKFKLGLTWIPHVEVCSQRQHGRGIHICICRYIYIYIYIYTVSQAKPACLIKFTPKETPELVTLMEKKTKKTQGFIRFPAILRHSGVLRS